MSSLIIPLLAESNLAKMQESLCKKLRLIATPTEVEYMNVTYTTSEPTLAGPDFSYGAGVSPDVAAYIKNSPYGTVAELQAASYADWISSGGGDTRSGYSSLLASYQAENYNWTTFQSVATPYTAIPTNIQHGWSVGGVNINTPSLASLNVIMAKNTTVSVLPYFILHGQNGGVTEGITYNSGENTYQYQDPGVTTTGLILEVYEMGLILPGQVIGYGLDINLPFPSTDPTAQPNIGNTLAIDDFYIPIIGVDLNTWLTDHNGFGGVIGTNTYLTPNGNPPPNAAGSYPY